MTSLDRQPPVRILAVSPRFAPTNGADTHRLRLLLNHEANAEWAVIPALVSLTPAPAGDIGGWCNTPTVGRLPK
jgi:hypothetical protein